MTTTNPNYQIEIVRKPDATRAFRAALFDFDGTLSLIREGWQNVMVPYFCEVLRGVDPDHKESDEQIERLVRDFVDKITGKQTIYQCIRLAEEVQARNGKALDPLEYKKEYLRRLQERIQSRVDALLSAQAQPDDYVVPGARAFLQLLRNAGYKLYLASGTDEMYVKQEAELLKLTEFFDGGVYGAQDDYKTFSKAMVIERLIRVNALDGAELVGFGDGYVEIENVRQVGGYAIGVATNEAQPGAGVDQWKRTRLLDAGADAIVPDFNQAQTLFDFISANTPRQ
ncbi:MAG: haloacid dehalogenase-like hydrolase [Planctomycetia bacterium]|nr:haloacid dehalogenase-like hydrolase [Planctomycetia bacterium]